MRFLRETVSILKNFHEEIFEYLCCVKFHFTA